MVRVKMAQPSLRAVIAGTACSKKIQTWPPLPDLDRSSAADTHISRQVSMNAIESSCQVFLSKSTARNQQVSSDNNGYTPMVSFPSR